MQRVASELAWQLHPKAAIFPIQSSSLIVHMLIGFLPLKQARLSDSSSLCSLGTTSYL